MNRLADETSPYLRQHAENPVDWYPWGDEALSRARDEDRPILLSIGYSACHWCHVMAHESFEDSATAAVMNERFVNVKVDREERPDLDAIYMDAVVAMTGSGGWPMTVFLTPAGEPFYGGTYFPPEPRHGLPSFRQLLAGVDEAWRERRTELSRAAAQLVEAVRHSADLRPSAEPLAASLLADAERGIAATFEPAFGGFGRAPKFPPASTLEFLLRRGGDRGARRWSSARWTGWPREACTTSSAAASTATRSTPAGSCRTSRRCCTTTRCSCPPTCTAGSVLGHERWRGVVEETCDYLLRELRLPDGGFASAQDADTDGVEGLTYTWTVEEGVPAELLEPFEHGRSIIRGALEPELRARLLAERANRPQPGLDDKAIASWNGLAIAALAEAGRLLRRADWIEAAEHAAEFVLGPLSDGDGRLRRSWRDGRTSGAGYLDDYANVAHGLLELHLATGEPRLLLEARRLALLAVELFADEEHGGFFLAPDGGEALIARTKDLDDNPVPSGNSMLAHVLLRLGRLWGEDELERRAVSVFRLMGPALGRAPGAFAWALCGVDLYLSPPRELAVVGPVDSPVAQAALGRFQPRTVAAVGPSDDVPLLAGKSLVAGLPAVYACERFACQAPVTDPADL